MQLTNMKKSVQIFCFLMIFSLLFKGGTSAVEAAARMYFDPASANKNLNEKFSVTIKADSGGVVTGSLDGVGTYDSSRLKLVSIDQSSEMTADKRECIINPIKGDGTFSFSCNTYSVVDDKAINGNVVVLNFEAKATGTAKVSFNCMEGSTSDTNIFDQNINDLIVCSSNGSGSYVIGESSSSSGTSTATNTPTTTQTTTTELPKTGSVGATIGLVSFGLVSLLSAVFLKFL